MKVVMSAIHLLPKGSNHLNHLAIIMAKDSNLNFRVWCILLIFILALNITLD